MPLPTEAGHVANRPYFDQGGSFHPNGSTISSEEMVEFGSAALNAVGGVVRAEGNVYAAAGNPIAGNAADLTDDILGGFQLPASVLDQAGRQIQVTAQGMLGATVNNKRYRIWLNPTMSGQTVNADGSISGGTVTAGTPAVDSGTQTGNGVGWLASLMLTKYGAAGSNTQKVQGQFITGATHGGITASQALTLPENAVINIVVTGASQTTGAASDVKLEQLTVTGSN